MSKSLVFHCTWAERNHDETSERIVTDLRYRRWPTTSYVARIQMARELPDRDEIRVQRSARFKYTQWTPRLGDYIISKVGSAYSAYWKWRLHILHIVHIILHILHIACNIEQYHENLHIACIFCIFFCILFCIFFILILIAYCAYFTY